MGVFSGQHLINKSGEMVDAEKELAGKVILVYFSAHWCPPCRGFTPTLKDCFEDLKGEDKPVVIVFVSSDRSDDEMKSYFKEDHGDWFCAPHNSPMANNLKKNCEVSGIPTLAVVNMNGDMLHKDARSDVGSTPPLKAFEKWQEISSK